MDTAINDRIKQIREAKGLSQAEFGESLGSGRGAIGNIEYYNTAPKPEFIALVCKIYNVSPSWLTTGEGEMFMPKSEEQEIESIFTNAQCEDPRKYKLLKVLARAISELPDEAIAAICDYAKEIADAAEDIDSPNE